MDDPDASTAYLQHSLDRARAGDAAGFNALYYAHARALIGYLRGRHVTDADDLANEVFVRAFRAIAGSPDDARRFRRWLLCIAHNAAVDDARRQRHRPRQVVLDAAFRSVGGNAETEAIARVESIFVDSLLAQLSSDQRDVILLRVVADLSVSHTAAVLNKSYEAVKALQRRAIASLRQMIDDRDLTTARSA